MALWGETLPVMLGCPGVAPGRLLGSHTSSRPPPPLQTEPWESLGFTPSLALGFACSPLRAEMIPRVTGGRHGCSLQCVYNKNKKEKDTKEKTAHVPAVEDSLYVTGWTISQPLTSMVLKTPRYRENTCCYEVRVKAESGVFSTKPSFYKPNRLFTHAIKGWSRVLLFLYFPRIPYQLYITFRSENKRTSLKINI